MLRNLVWKLGRCWCHVLKKEMVRVEDVGDFYSSDCGMFTVAIQQAFDFRGKGSG